MSIRSPKPGVGPVIVRCLLVGRRVNYPPRAGNWAGSGRVTAVPWNLPYPPGRYLPLMYAAKVAYHR